MNKYQIGFVIEQALGHVTHTKNLQAAVAHDQSVKAHWVLPEWETEGLAGKIPFFSSNWTVRAGLRARRGLDHLNKQTNLDALFFHTQVPAMLNADWLHRLPSVVSLDATPVQYDRLGAYYNHDTGPELLEKAKERLARYVFNSAEHLVTWAEWARQSLIDEYGVPPEKITVIPPGVDTEVWARPAGGSQNGRGQRPVRMLFVGGDLARKGGQELLEAFRGLRAEGVPVELHLVTRSTVEEEPGLHIYNNMQPNTEPLRRLFHESDLFCLPTYGDCLPLALAEAGAAGLPLVSTTVAGIPELVHHGENGLLVPPGNPDALRAALREMATDEAQRRVQGEAAARVARSHFDAATNARRLLELLKEVVDEANGAQRPLVAVAGRTDHKGEASVRQADVLLTVAGGVPAQLEEEIEEKRRPLADYVAMAATFNADILDYTLARKVTGSLGRLLERVVGPDLMLAWATYLMRHHYRVLFTDGEQIGLPLAALLKFGSFGVRPRHLMITHRISIGKKMVLLDLLKLHSHIDVFFVYATMQKEFIEERWNVPPEKVVWTPFMVDDRFFSPGAVVAQPVPDSLSDLELPVISAVGLEYRDYPTLMEAVEGLDVTVVIAAGSPWSKRDDSTEGREIPDNVIVRRFSQYDLRWLYAISKFVVMPLYDVDFQAGVTAILEAMAMGKAVICTQTPGQTDVIEDGETGVYVPPEDPEALRRAIRYLLENPQEADRMGWKARQVVSSRMNLEHYVRRLNKYVSRE